MPFLLLEVSKTTRPVKIIPSMLFWRCHFTVQMSFSLRLVLSCVCFWEALCTGVGSVGWLPPRWGRFIYSAWSPQDHFIFSDATEDLPSPLVHILAFSPCFMPLVGLHLLICLFSKSLPCWNGSPICTTCCYFLVLASQVCWSFSVLTIKFIFLKFF